MHTAGRNGGAGALVHSHAACDAQLRKRLLLQSRAALDPSRTWSHVRPDGRLACACRALALKGKGVAGRLFVLPIALWRAGAMMWDVTLVIVTAPISLARLLWAFGEDELWPRAFAMSPDEVADLAGPMGRLATDGDLDRLWPPPRPRSVVDAARLVVTIDHLEGAPRPSARIRRRPASAMPESLRRTEGQLYEDPGYKAVTTILSQRKRPAPKSGS